MSTAGPKFDKAHWARALKSPLWYVELVELIGQAKRELGEGSDELAAWLKPVRQFVAAKLTEGKVALATKGPNLDDQRAPVDSVIIHHTSAAPGYDLGYLNATQLLNIYAPYFVKPTDEREQSLRGQPLWSGHFYKSRQVFWVYHWLMRMDGSFERLLPDHQIGWHAGDWDINSRSMAICIDNDYQKQDPNPETLLKLGQFISSHYRSVPRARIFGHREINPKSISPGTNFAKWKPLLLEQL